MVSRNHLYGLAQPLMGWVAGLSETKGNSACPAKLEMELRLSLAILSELTQSGLLA